MKNAIILSFLLLTAAVFLLYSIKPESVEEAWSKTKTTLHLEKDEIRGQVEYAEGLVEKRSGEDDGWREVESGEVIKDGMEVRTLSGSRAVITFEDGSVVRLGSNGMFRLESEKDHLGINLSVGELYSRVTKNDQRKYVVKADGFEIVALGTAFEVEKEKSQEPQVKVIESQVRIKGSNDQEIGVVSAGEKSWVSAGSFGPEKMTNQDMQEEFLAWNLEKDEQHFKKETGGEKEKKVVEEKKEEKVVKKTVEKKETSSKEKKEKDKDDGYATTISLSGKADDTKARFNWTVSGGETPKGFKIVKSKQPNPVYPGDDYLYVSDPDDRSAVWKGFYKDKTYFFRICVYQGGKCGAYSNNVEIEFDGK